MPPALSPPAPFRPAYRAARKGRRTWWRRRLTAFARPLPDFLIAGAMKGGTTSLYEYLSRHPQVVPALVKEVHFFDANYRRGLGWYRAHFPTATERRGREARTGRPAITGEASPEYLSDPAAPQRIAATLPNAKLVVLLRDPVARAYSQYHHRVRRGREQLTFEEVIDRERGRLERGPEHVQPGGARGSAPPVSSALISRSLYAEQLERLFAVVARERVFVLKSEDFFADEQAQFDAVCRFLGIEPMDLGRPPVKNQGRYERAIPREAELRAFFEPHNRRLYDLLGRDFGW